MLERRHLAMIDKGSLRAAAEGRYSGVTSLTGEAQDSGALWQAEDEMRKVAATCAVSIIALSVTIPGITQDAPRSASKGPGQQGLLDNLFLLQNTKTARISSWDKSGGNADWVVIAP